MTGHRSRASGASAAPHPASIPSCSSALDAAGVDPRLDVGGIETNELPEYAEREAMLLHEAATDYLGPIGVRSWRGVSR